MALRTKEKFSSWELAVLVAATGIGSQIILAPNSLISTTKLGAWLCVIAGGLAFFAAGYMMLRLAALYPDKTLVEYLPAIWGKPLGFTLVFWYIFIHVAQVVLVMRGFSRVIDHTMFSRTPEEAIGLPFLALIAYGAMQSWGVIVRVQQFLLFTAVPLATALWLLSLLNFQVENIMPFVPDKFEGFGKGLGLTWNFYSGYELILLIYPLLYRQGLGYGKALAAAFGVMIVLFTVIIVSTIGVLSVNTASNIIYPTLAVIKGVEIPGTFVERLELYVILLWIPTVFDTHMVFLAVAAFTLTAVTRYGSHRLWLLLLLPPIIAAFYFIDSIKMLETAGNIVTVSGVAFSFVVVPLTLAAGWLRRRRDKQCGLSS